MLTIFSTPKDFEGIFKTIQENAIKSWRAVSDDIEIIILGDSKGCAEISKSINAKHIPDVRSNKNGIPYLSDLFKQAKKHARNDLLVFVNADIIFPKNFYEILSSVYSQKNNFLMVGYRWNMDVKDRIDFNDVSESRKFWKKAKIRGKKNPSSGIDYFVFKKDKFNNIPDFVIGRPGYDNWLLWAARRKLIPLIDLSNDIFAIHQNHHFNFHNLREDPKVHLEEDGLNNRSLHGNKRLNLKDVNYFTVDGIVKKNRSKNYKNRNLGKLQIIFPEFKFLIILYKKVYRRLMKMSHNSNP